MTEFLKGGPHALEAARAAMIYTAKLLHTRDGIIKARKAGAVRRLENITLLPPVMSPGKILCIGKNYKEHAEEMGGQAEQAFPEIFTRFPSTLVAPGAPVYVPPETDEWDYEAELMVVIGSRGRRIPEDKALEHVAGYTCFNDVSARTFQKRITQWTAGKNFDSSGPMGPSLVTPDEVGDPQSLDIRCEIDGEVVQESNTKNLIFSIPFLISHISEFLTLEPGDVISTGTPGGVGFARTPPRFLKPGETVKVIVEKVGVLENPVVAEGEK